VERRRCRLRRSFAPEQIDEPVGRDDPARIEEKCCEERALAMAAESDRARLVGNLEWPQDPKFEHVETFVTGRMRAR